MSVFSLGKLQNVLPEFVETRMLPVAPPTVQWMLAGLTPLVMQNLGGMVDKYKPTLKALGMLDEQDRLDLEKTRQVFDAGFSKCEKVPLLGFNFDRTDGEALLGILDKYKD